MAETLYSPHSTHVSATHKRSFDDMDPDLAPTNHTGSSVASSSVGSSSAAASRERNKRARNDSESSYSSEIDEILVSSVSPSSSGSSLSSYHSARSSLDETSPLLMPSTESADVSAPTLDISSASASFTVSEDSDVPMDGVFSFTPSRDSISPVAPVPTTQDSSEQFRITMERVDAFDRQMAAFRQSPLQQSQHALQPSWIPVAEHPGRAETLNTAMYPPPGALRLSPPSRSMLSTIPGESSSSSHSLRNVQLPSGPSYFALQEQSHHGNRGLSHEDGRDTAHHMTHVGRLREHQEFFSRVSRVWNNSTEPEPLPSATSSSVATSVDPTASRSLPHRRTHSSHSTINSPGVNPVPSASQTLSDDFWRLAHEREIRSLDRTIREVEAHRQRVADFLGDHALRPSASRTSSSSFSTLRGALGENGNESPPRWSPPRRTNAPSRSEDISAITPTFVSAVQPSVPLLDEDFAVTIPPWNGPFDHLPPSSSGLSSPRASSAQPQSMSTAPEQYSEVLSIYNTSPPLPMQSTSAFNSSEGHVESDYGLRSSSRGGLRQRTRQLSQSLFPPPPPLRSASPTNVSYRAVPSRVPPATSSLSGFTQLTYSEDANSALFAPSPNRGSQQIENPPLQPYIPSFQTHRLPTNASAAPYGNFDLDAYHEGPFRATLARSIAMQQRRIEQTHNLQPRVGPTITGRNSRDINDYLSHSSDEDEADEFSATIETIRRQQRALRRELNALTHSPVSGNSFTALHDPLHTTGRGVPSLGASERRIVSSQAEDDFPGMSARARRIALNRQLRPRTLEADAEASASEQRRADIVNRQFFGATRHRTLLDRERSINTPRAMETQMQENSETSAHANGLDRWEQRRDAFRRMSRTRFGGAVNSSDRVPPSPLNPSPTPTASLIQRNTSTTPASFASRQQRAVRYPPPQPSSRALPESRESRAESRAPPLNGRFARARGLHPHLPPDMVLLDLPSMHSRLPPHLRRRGFGLGDFMRDEDIDMSYEGLLSLSSLLGDAKPRGTPADVVSSLPKGTYEQWMRPGHSEERCPICLDDYQPKDECLRIPSCSHWFHQGCLQQWLKGSRTCPVCRGRVNRPPRSSEASAPVAGPSGFSSHTRSSNPSGNNSSSGSGGGSSSNNRDVDEDSDDDRMPRYFAPYRPPWRYE